MRIAARIPLLLAVTGALWLGARGPSLMAETSTKGPGASVVRTDRPLDETGAASEGAKAAASMPRGGKSAAAGPAGPAATPGPRTTPLSGSETAPEAEDEPEWSELDSAPESVIRHTLTRAVDREQSLRPLFVSTGVIETAATRGEVRVIFNTGDTETRSALAELLTGATSGRSGGARWEGLRLFPLLDHGAAQVGPQALLHLIEADAIVHIELDSVHRPSLDASIPLIRADLAHEAGEDGDGFAIAILDTGVDTTHPMLAGRVLDEACFSVELDCPNGEAQMFGPGAAVPCTFGCNHGTRVAGVAAGADTGDALVGVAPHASIIPIQVFSNVDGAAGAYASDILAGLQHVLALTAYYDIAAANLSFGGTLYNSEASCDEAAGSQRAAVELLRAAGVATVAAAGNQSMTNAMTTPACLSNVIGVGSSSRADTVSSYSNSAEFLSLLAPGESIESAENGGGTAIGNGTSLSTPHVSGAIAVLREAVPNATVAEIESALALSGVPIFDSRNGITKPRIQVDEAVALLAAATNGSPAPVSSGGSAGGGGPASVASSGGSSGGSSCGLIGIEPFLALAAIQLTVRRRACESPSA